jgi:hypothetical protein
MALLIQTLRSSSRKGIVFESPFSSALALLRRSHVALRSNADRFLVVDKKKVVLSSEQVNSLHIPAEEMKLFAAYVWRARRGLIGINSLLNPVSACVFGSLLSRGPVVTLLLKRESGFSTLMKAASQLHDFYFSLTPYLVTSPFSTAFAFSPLVISV